MFSVCSIVSFIFFFFFKQKTAYEMRISDWSSDVCSSDLCSEPECRLQFTVTTKTPLHATKLPLWKWVQGIYFMLESSKGVSSVIMASWLGISQKSAWKICHALRLLLSQRHDFGQLLSGTVELDDKFFGEIGSASCR